MFEKKKKVSGGVSGFLLFFLGSREKNIVKNKPVTGRIGVEVQVGGRVAHGMAVIFRVVASVEGPGSVS